MHREALAETLGSARPSQRIGRLLGDGEPGGALDGVGGLGQERPEELEDVRRRRVELEPRVDAVLAGALAKAVGVREHGSPVAAWISIGGRPLRSADNGLTTGSSVGWPAR